MVDLRDAIVAALTWISMVNLQEKNVSSWNVNFIQGIHDWTIYMPEK